jgi:hypothetical protein
MVIRGLLSLERKFQHPRSSNCGMEGVRTMSGNDFFLRVKAGYLSSATLFLMTYDLEFITLC